jgi:hypothetical protein
MTGSSRFSRSPALRSSLVLGVIGVYDIGGTVQVL